MLQGQLLLKAPSNTRVITYYNFPMGYCSQAINRGLFSRVVIASRDYCPAAIIQAKLLNRGLISPVEIAGEGRLTVKSMFLYAYTFMLLSNKKGVMLFLYHKRSNNHFLLVSICLSN